MVLPSKKESTAIVTALVIWLAVTTLCVGFRPEHLWLALLIASLFFACRTSRKTVVALLPFIIFGISYDWMNIVHNYDVNPVDIRGLYEAEKSLFGITAATGEVLTPNEFFARHTSTLMDILGGFFYLCWVPVPIFFGLYLYFGRQVKIYLHFAIVFLLVNLIGFAGYYIHPAAPPWYVALYGFDFIEGTPGSVAGLGHFDEITGLGIFNGLYGRNSNVFAAVPLSMLGAGTDFFRPLPLFRPSGENLPSFRHSLPAGQPYRFRRILYPSRRAAMVCGAIRI